MKNTLSRRFAGVLLAVFSAMLLPAGAAADTYVSPTKYDWSGLATSITSPSKSNYDKAYDIYRWLAENVAYDTSYAINTADATYENMRGVCQGYAELFYRLGNAVGLKSDIIFGKSKDIDGKVGDIGHAWLFVYVDGNSGMLIDPTWGAGTVSNGVFSRSVTDEWFNFSPQWAIFTHFPDDSNYQLISSEVSFSQFCSLPAFRPSMGAYGYDGSAFLESSLAGSVPETPVFYHSTINSAADVLRIPQERTLRVGRDYEFYFKPKRELKMAIISGSGFYHDWVSSGSQVAARFMPSKAGKLTVAFEDGNNQYSSMIEYDVAAPTEAEIAALEASDPIRSPYFDDVKNFNADAVRQVELDPHYLLKTLRDNNIKALPKLYTQVHCYFREVPLTEMLNSGEEYVFRLGPGQGRKWAVINGDGSWCYQSEEESTDSEVVIRVTPVSGKLQLAAQTPKSGSSFNIVAEYLVR